jgi:trk system potassium uptake protein TrkA
MNIVILGCGRMGALMATRFVAEGHRVSIIDRHGDAFRRLGSGFSGRLVLGTGVDEDVLKRAGIEQADVFVAATDCDNTNIMATQVVKEIFHVPKVVARIYDPLRQETYRSLGLVTVCPTVLGADKVKELLADG